MQKAFFLLLAALLIAQYNSDDSDECGYEDSGNSFDECKNLKISSHDEYGNELKYCCFFKGKVKDDDDKMVNRKLCNLC